ncbi:hypothetical protein Trydic_g20724 [Trypoxylus dichotomus]
MWCVIVLVLYGIILSQNVPSETKTPSQDDLMESTGKQICPEIEVKSGNRILKWRATPAGKIAIPEEPCLDDSEEYIVRECLPSSDLCTWSTPNSHCSDDYVLSNVTEDLYEYFKKIHYDIEINDTHIDTFFKRFSEFQAIDYTILFDCLNRMPTRSLQDDLRRLVNLMSSLRNPNQLDLSEELRMVVWDRLNVHMKNMPRSQNNVTFIAPNVVISSWKPFLSNITGIALYNYTKEGFTNASIVYIYANQTSSNIDRTNLQLAAYVPYEFLEQLIADATNEAQESLYIIMSIINNDTYVGWELYTVNNVTDVIGVSIPNFCKKNNNTLLNVFFKDSSENDWITFGTEYVDLSTDPAYTCALFDISSFGYIYSSSEIKQYFESVKQDYCMHTTLVTNNRSEIVLKQTESGKIVYPENFCVGRNATIPKAMCLPTGRFILLSAYESDCVDDHPVSNLTHQLYKAATECWSINETQAIINYSNHTEMAYLDKILLFSVMWCLMEYKAFNRDKTGKSADFIANLYDEAYGFIDEIPKKFIDLTYLTYPLAFYYTLVNYKYPNVYLLIKPNFIYFVTAPFSQDITGLVLYKVNNGTSLLSYEVRYLTPRNISKHELMKNNVELIVFIPPATLNEASKNLTSEEKTKVCAIVTILCSYKFLEADHIIESHVVGVKHVSDKSIRGCCPTSDAELTDNLQKKKHGETTPHCNTDQR